MTSKGKRILLVAVLAAAAAGGYVAFAGSKHDDRAEIAQALQEAVKASREGRPGGVVAYLASNVVVNGQRYDVNGQFENFIRKYHPDITLGKLNPKIVGDDATVKSDIEFSVLNQSLDVPEVTFTLRREHTTKWLILPDQEWKVTGATAPEQDYEQIESELQLMGGGNSIF